MPHHADWLPSSREARYTMAKTWESFIGHKNTVLNIPTAVIDSLTEKIAELEKLTAVGKSARTPAMNTEIKTADDELITIMRDIKKRYFFIPPLTEADFTTLGLKPKDTNPTPVGAPTGLAKADVTYPGGSQVHLHIKHIDGTPLDARADYGFKIFYGLYASGDAPPATGKELRENIFTRQKKHLFSFEPEDSGKRAHFCIRYENGKGEKGPWGPLFSAVIP